MKSFVVLLVLITSLNGEQTKSANGFSFSPYYNDHMVLQKSSAGTIIWGHSTKKGDVINIKINNHQVSQASVDDHHIWQAKLPDPAGNGPYVITASSSLGVIRLNDVLFGDVWVCSGQSNMEFFTNGLLNATAEIADGTNYPNVRLFKVGHVVSNTAYSDITQVDQTWTRPVGNALKYFSAVCWLYGKYLSQHLNYPIGLVETNWGGTRIEAWSSSDALSKCTTVSGSGRKRSLNPNSESVLYNGMISPLLRNTIKGAIWYQGESNAGRATQYACQFPVMISDWRYKFNAASLDTTNINFPFGFVQLAPNRNVPDSHAMADLRWAQTANVGYVPNSKLPNVFMAVAIDLPDFTSPTGSIHPRYKHDVALRLVLSALHVVYHQTGIDFQGPFPSSFRFDSLNKGVIIEYGNGLTPIDVRTNDGFEVCCAARDVRFGCMSWDKSWTKVKIRSHSDYGAILNGTSCNYGSNTAVHVRYAWYESPCSLKQCAIYGRDNDLPAPPFVHTF